MEAIGPAAQNRCVAGLKAQRAGVRGDVWPALIDDANHAQWHGNALDLKAVRPGPAVKNPPNRVRQLGDGIKTTRNGVDARIVEHQPVDEGRRLTGLFGRGHIARIGF